LDRFVAAFQASGRFTLMQGKSNGTSFDLNHTYMIEKRELIVREAWEIGVNDLDVVGLHADDDPMVPSGSRSPLPYEAVMQRLRTAPY
ncbi:MAG: hypothetical protein JWM57_1255, partial [Phycisphaerales bacterium]|nr:hypothetical protein [Phycisphaerales bacterium]